MPPEERPRDADADRLMRIGIVCDPSGLSHWQARAVERIATGNSLFLLMSSKAPRARRRTRHLAYYALNLASIRNGMTRRVPFPDVLVRARGRLDFEPSFDGAWAALPDDALEWIREQRLDCIVKFGLELLRIPKADHFGVPIISFHHGDPRRYRGRPAGFYELLNGERFVGQVVQVLSNKLDQGKVLAFAESRVFPHSYRKTLVECYRLSPFLLQKAVAAVAEGSCVAIEPNGSNYRLPPNFTVLKFLAGRLRNVVARLAYGLFVQKCWAVASLADCGDTDPLTLVEQAEQNRSKWRVVPRPRRYAFYADPFFLAGPEDIVVEAMSAWSGRGELVRLRNRTQQRLAALSGHVSYPASITEEGQLYLVPEISDWSPPAIYRAEDGKARRVAELDCDGARLIDPTLVRHGDRLFLFANTVEHGTSVLHLWSAPSLFDRFEPHRCSPIRVSARGSRMAGQILTMSGGMYRLGQDFGRNYGDGILLFRIEQLNSTTYREELIGEAAFKSVHGPHTVNFADGTLLFDWYQERLSPLSGVRRLFNLGYRIISR